MSVRFSFQGPRQLVGTGCVGVANHTRRDFVVNLFFRTVRSFFSTRLRELGSAEDFVEAGRGLHREVQVAATDASKVRSRSPSEEGLFELPHVRSERLALPGLPNPRGTGR